jgi:hypothetical protein
MLVSLFLLSAGYFLYLLLKPPVEKTARRRIKLLAVVRPRPLRGKSPDDGAKTHV